MAPSYAQEYTLTEQTSIHPPGRLNDLAATIDHTLLKPTARQSEILALCDQAVTWKFKAVCVQPSFLPLARSRLAGSQVACAVVCAFPHGALLSAQKTAEAELALSHGADEIDVVANLGQIRDGNWSAMETELAQLRALGRYVLKVILETSELDEAEKRAATEVVAASGADYVKTSTGFGSGGATPSDVALLAEVAGQRCQVKASGGIRNLDSALTLLSSGASRIGTSQGVAILEQARSAGWI